MRRDKEHLFYQKVWDVYTLSVQALCSSDRQTANTLTSNDINEISLLTSQLLHKLDVDSKYSNTLNTHNFMLFIFKKRSPSRDLKVSNYKTFLLKLLPENIVPAIDGISQLQGTETNLLLL